MTKLAESLKSAHVQFTQISITHYAPTCIKRIGFVMYRYITQYPHSVRAPERVDRWGPAETLLHLSLLFLEGGKGGAETGVFFTSTHVDLKKNKLRFIQLFYKQKIAVTTPLLKICTFTLTCIFAFDNWVWIQASFLKIAVFQSLNYNLLL